jgi:hypothetical protein
VKILRIAAYQLRCASAYIGDIKASDLPASARKDIEGILPDYAEDAMAIQYGMVVDELVAKADPHNWKQAMEHVEQGMKGKDFEKTKQEFFDKKDKYILLINDRIADGHHYLARAKFLGITNSLKVLDLSPLRLSSKD